MIYLPTEEGRVTYSGKNLWLERDIKDVVIMCKESITLDKEKIMTKFKDMNFKDNFVINCLYWITMTGGLCELVPVIMNAVKNLRAERDK